MKEENEMKTRESDGFIETITYAMHTTTHSILYNRISMHYKVNDALINDCSIKF